MPVCRVIQQETQNAQNDAARAISLRRRYAAMPLMGERSGTGARNSADIAAQ